MKRGGVAYKVCCWGKGESSKESKKTTEERENNPNKHGEC